MGDIEKPIEEISEDIHGRKSRKLNAAQEENAVGYKEYVEARDLDISDAEMKRVRWKLDLIILPMFLITQALQFMDKTSLNYANLFGYQKALGLKGQQFSYLSAMVYAGYFFGQYPCGWLIGRYPAQKVMAISIFMWGTMVIIMTQCRSYSSALVVRFIMGIFEAAVTPGLTLMTGFWYTRREIPLRQCIWYSSLGWGGIIGSYISMGVSKLPADMSPGRWELIFYIVSIPDDRRKQYKLTHLNSLVARHVFGPSPSG
jgi:MFS family permease